MQTTYMSRTSPFAMLSLSWQVIRRITPLIKFVFVEEVKHQRPALKHRYFQTLLDKNWTRNREDAIESSLQDKGAPQKDDKVSQIVLLDADDNRIGLMTLTEAQRLAKKKDLKLIKVEDPARKNKRDVYLLLTGTQLHQERMRQKEVRKSNESVNKGDKTLIIGAKITPHDLQIKIKTIKKWLEQNYHIRVTIHNDASDSAERTYAELENTAVEIGGRILQKRKAADGSTIKFTFQLEKKE